METLDYYDYEELIKAFWSANIKQDYSNFDFIKAFESLENPIYQKLSEHGFLTIEDFEESQDEIYNYDCLKELEQITDYIQITQEDLKKAIIEFKYKKNKEEFTTGMYSNLDELKKIYDKIQIAKTGEMERKEMVLLFDEVIHAEHETGEVLDLGESISSLKENFEKGLNQTSTL